MQLYILIQLASFMNRIFVVLIHLSIYAKKRERLIILMVALSDDCGINN